MDRRNKIKEKRKKKWVKEARFEKERRLGQLKNKVSLESSI